MPNTSATGAAKRCAFAQPALLYPEMKFWLLMEESTCPKSRLPSCCSSQNSKKSSVTWTSSLRCLWQVVQSGDCCAQNAGKF